MRVKADNNSMAVIVDTRRAAKHVDISPTIRQLAADRQNKSETNGAQN